MLWSRAAATEPGRACAWYCQTQGEKAERPPRQPQLYFMRRKLHISQDLMGVGGECLGCRLAGECVRQSEIAVLVIKCIRWEDRV